MKILYGDSRRTLEQIDDESVDTIVTSPPYLAQRIYGTSPDEIGNVDTLAEYLDQIRDVTRHLERILRPTGSLWWNIGDKANGSGGSGGDWNAGGLKGTAAKVGAFRDPSYPTGSFLDVPGQTARTLVRDGWKLRLPIVWNKGREAPEALSHVRRPRWSHEMIYLFAHPAAIRMKFYPSGLVETGSVWNFPPGGEGPSHLAPFPDELARRAILATTLPGDVVLDPFSGSGTVPRVAEQLGRVGIGCELYEREGTS